MKQPIRYFSLGLLTATLVLFIVYTIFDTSHSTKDVELSIEEMIEELENNGQRVISEDDYITYTVNKDVANNNKKENENDSEDNHQENTDKNQSNSEDEKEQDVVTYTIDIKSNMMPSQVADKLADHNIVDDAFEFAKYLDDEGYSPYVQIGKFELTSELSEKEVAEKITKNRKP